MGTVLLDLCKAFDCILHDLLAAKLHAYCLPEDSVTFVHSYSKRRKQAVKLNDTESVFQILSSSIAQDSTSGPNLFNICISYFIFSIKDVLNANFADHNI